MTDGLVAHGGLFHPLASVDTEAVEQRFCRLVLGLLLRRIYEVDPLLCPCGGELKIISVLTEPMVVDRILGRRKRKGPSCALSESGGKILHLDGRRGSIWSVGGLVVTPIAMGGGIGRKEGELRVLARGRSIPLSSACAPWQGRSSHERRPRACVLVQIGFKRHAQAVPRPEFRPGGLAVLRAIRQALGGSFLRYS